MKSRHNVKKAKNRTRRKQKGGTKAKTIEECLRDIDGCFREHDAEVNDCSLIVVDIISIGSYLSGTNHLFLLFEDIMLKYNISLEKIYAFCDFDALLRCYTELGGKPDKKFIDTMLNDECPKTNRRISKNFLRRMKESHNNVLDLFLPFLRKIQNNSVFLNNIAMSNINSRIIKLFEDFIKSSLLKVDTGNLILNVYSHGVVEEGKGVLGFSDGSGHNLIDADTFYTMISTPILSAEKLANFILVNGACFAYTFLKEFVNIPSKDSERAFGNILALGNTTDIRQLPVCQFIYENSGAILNKKIEYSELKELTYKDVKLELLIDEEAYTSDEFFEYNYYGQTNHIGNHNIYLVSLLFEAAAKKMGTKEEIINYLRDEMYSKYKELTMSDDDFTRVPFFTKKMYEKHELFSDELKDQLLMTYSMDDGAFVEYFNKLN